jgi:hypothetical protein
MAPLMVKGVRQEREVVREIIAAFEGVAFAG